MGSGCWVSAAMSALLWTPGSRSRYCPGSFVLRLMWVVCAVSCGGQKQAGGVQGGEEVVVERAAS